MSGPNDSGSGATPAGDFKLTLPEIGATATPSDRFKLKVAWQTPHLEWQPIKGSDSTDTGAAAAASPPPPPSNPEKAVEKADRYFKSGLLFDLLRPNWDLVDKAFLTMPNGKSLLFPEGPGLKVWQDDVFFRGLGSMPYIVLPPAPTTLPNLTLIGPPASPFFKQPEPAAMNRDSGPPRTGGVGDVLKAVWGLPVTQQLVNLANDEAKRQLRLIGRDFSNLSFWYQASAVAFGATIAGGALAGVLGTTDSRQLAAKSLLGLQLPVPFAPAFSFELRGYGPLNDILLGTPGPGLRASGELGAVLHFDPRKAIKIIHDNF